MAKKDMTYPSELLGAWQFSGRFKKSGEMLPSLPPEVPKPVWVFRAGGAAQFFQGKLDIPMTWGVIDGRLRIADRRGSGSHRFECPDPDTLVLLDQYGGRDVLVRVQRNESIDRESKDPRGQDSSG